MSDFLSLCAQSEGAAEAAMDWGIVGSTVVTGIVVVFLILAILVAFLSLMGKILGAKKKEAPAPAPKPEPAQNVQTVQAAAELPEEEEEDDAEIIAVISAAIAAYGEAEGRQYRVTGVRRQRDKAVRSGWSAAGVAENTKSF